MLTVGVAKFAGAGKCEFEVLRQKDLLFCFAGTVAWGSALYWEEARDSHY